MTCGVYLLSFKNTHKVYVGKSISIEKRYREHLRDFKSESHTYKLMDAYTQYGVPELEIIEECLEEILATREEYHINLWNAVTDGFNYQFREYGGCLSGEAHPASTYSNTHMLKVLEYIVENPSISLVQVSKDTETSYNVVKSLANGITHKWLQDINPEAYYAMLATKGTRNNRGESQGASKFTNIQIEQAFFKLLEDITVPNKEIAKEFGISEGAVVGICSGANYSWIEEKYPEEFTILQTKLADKRKFSRCAKARGIKYPHIISPIDGAEYTVESVSAFARAHSLDVGSLNKVLNGKQGHTKGWKLK
jgi:group I intron endonuclease